MRNDAMDFLQLLEGWKGEMKGELSIWSKIVEFELGSKFCSPPDLKIFSDQDFQIPIPLKN
ncbi:hypothetical protein CPB83DRAFT_842378 [Crepidotus variabilis]|uniref:Uncharacterized protein n=1 Tax=Crepidotus variabilis TaxID=179855 RepID=A0A9P6JX25_9AGAR|nr:hypothetical protein CPB83DRAFT_842378 [Crepidotus variabilis]